MAASNQAQMLHWAAWMSVRHATPLCQLASSIACRLVLLQLDAWMLVGYLHAVSIVQLAVQLDLCSAVHCVRHGSSCSHLTCGKNVVMCRMRPVARTTGLSRTAGKLAAAALY